MMREAEFPALVRRLFARLGLAEPRFDATGIVRLRIEAVGVNLTDTGTGRLLIEAQVGTLPEEGPNRSEAVRDILRMSAGLILDNEAGTFLRALPGGREGVVVQAGHPYRPDDLDRLVRRIEDVVHLAELHGASLSSAAARPARPAPVKSQAQGAVQDVLIFRP